MAAEKKEGTRARRSPASVKALTSLDGKISIPAALPFGLQHVLAMFVSNLAPIFIVAGVAGFPAEQSEALIQNALLIAGLGTLIQLFPLWRIGSGLPIVMGVSFTYVAAVTTIVATQGFEVAVGAIVVGGLFEGVLGLTVGAWRRFVPPVISAVVVTATGFSLLSVGAQSFGGGSGAADFGSVQNLVLGTVSLLACLIFQGAAKGTLKQLSVLFGLVVGYVVALPMGMVDFSSFEGMAIVALPQFMPFTPHFEAGAIVTVALLYLVSAVEVIGDTTALTAVGLNRTPTERELGGAISGDGVLSCISGLFGCLPITSYAQNVGLVAMTKVVNRKVIACGAAVLVLAAFFPPIAAVFNSLPDAVLGGCTIMMFGNIVVSGFQMVASAGFTQRNILIVALALAIGIGFTQVSDIFVAFPELFQSIFASNCIVTSFVVAVVANLLLPNSSKLTVGMEEAAVDRQEAAETAEAPQDPATK